MASGTHDPLQASLVWVRDRQAGEVLWIGIDALCVDEELTRRIAAAVGEASGCAADAVLVCASHTHSSAAGWVAGLGPMLPETADPQLRDGLVELLADAARSLSGRLVPRGRSSSEGSAPEAGGNRNDPNGPHDASVGVLAPGRWAGWRHGDGRRLRIPWDGARTRQPRVVRGLAGATRRSLAAALSGLTPFAARDAMAELPCQPSDRRLPARERPATRALVSCAGPSPLARSTGWVASWPRVRCRRRSRRDRTSRAICGSLFAEGP